MATCNVTFLPAGVTIAFEPEEAPLTFRGMPGSLMDIAIAHDIHIEHACGGVGACATCHVIVEKGMENLSIPDDDELDLVDQAPGATLNSRLACKALVRGDVTVRIPEWNRNLVSEKH